jgi:hypothetical protein
MKTIKALLDPSKVTALEARGKQNIFSHLITGMQEKS